MGKILSAILSGFILIILSCSDQHNRNYTSGYFSGKFIHPGMVQSASDLNFMKQKVIAGEQPWKSAFENLQKRTKTDFKPVPFTHVSVGPYGANSRGGREFSESATASYNHALMWYLTGDRVYADKAIEILNAWSGRLWDFDENNAKLNVGLSGFYYLNAAEIMKNSDSGWKDEDIKQFRKFVLTVFYPTIKDFFTEANGNWDGSIISTMLCIGVFTDNTEIFNRALERYYRGPGNSGITKYIYPGGQPQEATRDWVHVQLGLGEFAKAAQTAWTQGIDLYSVADDRLAQGFEYTAQFLLNEKVPVYGKISLRERDKIRDIYESILFHYRSVRGTDLKYCSRIIESTRPNSGEILLISLRAPAAGNKGKSALIPFPGHIALQTGAQGEVSAETGPDVVMVNPGESIQGAINTNKGTGKWIILKKGVHILSETLLIPSGVNISGEGIKTVLFLKPGVNSRTISNATADMSNVVLKDFIVEGAVDTATSFDPNNDRRIRSYMSAPAREGIVFSADSDKQMSGIRLINITLRNFTKNGVSIRGAQQVKIENCDFSDNGGNVVPGQGFHHNLHLTHITNCEVLNSRFDNSPWGSGLDLSFSSDVAITGNESARNRISGIRCFENKNVIVKGNLVEGNDENGIAFESLMDGNENIIVTDNISRNNGEYGIVIEKSAGKTVRNNSISDNRLGDIFK